MNLSGVEKVAEHKNVGFLLENQDVMCEDDRRHDGRIPGVQNACDSFAFVLVRFPPPQVCKTWHQFGPTSFRPILALGSWLTVRSTPYSVL